MHAGTSPPPRAPWRASWRWWPPPWGAGCGARGGRWVAWGLHGTCMGLAWDLHGGGVSLHGGVSEACMHACCCALNRSRHSLCVFLSNPTNWTLNRTLNRALPTPTPTPAARDPTGHLRRRQPPRPRGERRPIGAAGALLLALQRRWLLAVA